MMKIFLLSCALFMLGVVPPALAGSHDHHAGHEGQIRHYEPEKPKSEAEALATLKEKLTIMKQALDQGAMESVHEGSYSLEAAADYLLGIRKNDRAFQAATEEMAEQIQIVHADSENGKADATRKAWPSLEAAIAKVTALAHR